MDELRTEHAEFSVPADSTGPTYVRRVLAEMLVGRSVAVRNSAALVASELVTNAIRHSRPPLQAIIDFDSTMIRIAVSDPVADPPSMRDVAGADGGFGMHIIDGLCQRWGSDANGEGKTVWCELRDVSK